MQIRICWYNILSRDTYSMIVCDWSGWSMISKSEWLTLGTVQESYWMTETTRVKALEKASKFTQLIAYDDYLMSDNTTALNLEHGSFTPNGTYFHNYIKGRQFETQVEGRMLVKGNNPSDWITGPAIVNAFYSPNHNSICRRLHKLIDNLTYTRIPRVSFFSSFPCWNTSGTLLGSRLSMVLELCCHRHRHRPRNHSRFWRSG